MKVVIDRFEEGYAVCEGENFKLINIERRRIPSEAREGDVLIIENNIIRINCNESEKRKNEVNRLIEELWKE